MSSCWLPRPRSMRPVARLLMTALLLIARAAVAAPADGIHFLVPGGAGGGWDSTARGVGDVLVRTGLTHVASFENMSGGGGGRALAHLIETAARQHGTLMISSTPIIVRSLKQVFPQSWRDLTPVACLIVDYGAFVVRSDSNYQTWDDVLTDFRRNPRKVNVAGGSVRGSTDHLVAALAFQKSGEDPASVKYIPYNAGSHAMVGLLSGESQLLSTGLSEALALARQGEVRILAVTAEERLAGADEVPTLAEQGVDAVFGNWRGVFGAPGISVSLVADYNALLAAMYATSEWQQTRTHRGWTDLYLPGAQFVRFLERQERDLGRLIAELGLR